MWYVYNNKRVYILTMSIQELGGVRSPLTGNGATSTTSSAPTMMAEVGRQPSAAYKNSKRESYVRTLQLDAQGKSARDFEFHTGEGDDEPGEII